MASTHLSLVLAVLAVASLPGTGQESRVTDEGSFTILVNGRTSGRENFRITAVPRGDQIEYLAKADVTFGDRKVAPELRVDASGAALDYQATTRSGGDETTWRGTISRGRLSATITTPRGTAAREFIVPAGAVVLDTDVLHQHYFVARRTRSGRIPVVVPARNAQMVLTVTTVGSDVVQVGTQELAATHLRLEEPSGATRSLWVDAAGRVLKVAIPGLGILAIRDDPPRG